MLDQAIKNIVRVSQAGSVSIVGDELGVMREAGQGRRQSTRRGASDMLGKRDRDENIRI